MPDSKDTDPQGFVSSPVETLDQPDQGTSDQQNDESDQPQTEGDVSSDASEGDAEEENTTGESQDDPDENEESIDEGSARRHLGEMTKAVHNALKSDDPKAELKKVLSDPNIRAAYEKKYGAVDDEDPLEQLLGNEPQAAQQISEKPSAELTEATAKVAKAINIGIDEAKELRAKAMAFQKADSTLSAEQAVELARYQKYGATKVPPKRTPKNVPSLPPKAADESQLSADEYAARHNLIGVVE